MERNFRARRKAGQTGRHVLCADLFGDQGDRSDPVAALDNGQRVDFQNMRIGHRDYLLSQELGPCGESNHAIEGASSLTPARLRADLYALVLRRVFQQSSLARCAGPADSMGAPSSWSFFDRNICSDSIVTSSSDLRK